MALRKIQLRNPVQDKVFNTNDFVYTSLFNEALVLRDFDKDLNNFFENEEISGFFEFWIKLCSFAHQYNKNRNQYNDLNYEETLNLVILPILEILGHIEVGSKTNNTYSTMPEVKTYDSSSNNISINPSIVLTNNHTESSSFDHHDLVNNVNTVVVCDYFDSFGDIKINKYNENKTLQSKVDDPFFNLNHISRCTEYLNLGHKDYGIVTDGARWILVNKTKTKEDERLVYEFNLLKFIELIEGESGEDNLEYLNVSKWFFWFFSKKGLFDGGLPFISEVELKSRKYATQIEDDMRTRFVHAMTIGLNGYVDSAQRLGGGKYNVDEFVATTESLLFNLFFLRSCESKGAIPFHQGYKKISLANLVNKIQNYNTHLTWRENALQISKLENILGKNVKEDGYEIYDHIHNLFKIIKNGESGFHITGFIETVFNDNEYEIYVNNKLKNSTMISLLHELMFFNEDSVLKQIPYNNFSPRQLGSIYESFLEFKPMKSKSKLYYLKKETRNNKTWQWLERSKIPNKYNLKSLYSVNKGKYIFAPNNEDRKASGAFYTPQFIVGHIVQRCLSQRTSRITSKEDLLSIKVCDPAMGSGHFLVEALNFLTNEYFRITSSKESSASIRREILDACIFGADVNSRSVKLAKMSLWLSTAYPGKKLERLDDQILNINSLNANWESEFPIVWRESKGFDFILGNPPFIETKLIPDDEKPFLYAEYRSMFEKSNYYVCFFELSKRILSPKVDSVISLVCPPDWIDPQKSYKKFKSFLKDNLCLFEMTKLDKRAFPVPTNVFSFRHGCQNIDDIPFYSLEYEEDESDPEFRKIEDLPKEKIVGIEVKQLKGAANLKTIKVGDALHLELGISLNKSLMAKAKGDDLFLGEGVKEKIFLNKNDREKRFNYDKALKLKTSNDRLRTKNLFNCEKIIIKRRPYTAIYDSKRIYCKSNCFILKNKKGKDLNLKYISLILNTSYFRNLIHGAFEKAQIGKDYFNDLEIPYIIKPDFEIFFKSVTKLKEFSEQVAAIDNYFKYIFNT